MNENKYDIQHACNYDELLKENARLKELNREVVEALKWLLNLRSGRAKGGDDFSAEAQWDDAWESAIKAIVKAEEEGEWQLYSFCSYGPV